MGTAKPDAKSQRNTRAKELPPQARRRALGNMQFIGELHKKRMITSKVVHECVRSLLGKVRSF